VLHRLNRLAASRLSRSPEPQASSSQATCAQGLYSDDNHISKSLPLHHFFLRKNLDGTMHTAGKAFRLLWQPIFSVSRLNSLALRHRFKGIITFFRGGCGPLPPAMQVTDARGFYFLQEAVLAAGQDTLYYELYMHNTSLANGAKDDTLRHRAIQADHPSSGSKQPVPTLTEPCPNASALRQHTSP